MGATLARDSHNVTKDDREIVSAVQAALLDKVGKSRFDVWFGANTTLSLQPRGLVVAVPNRFYHDWLRTNFRGQIEAACQQALGRATDVYFEIRASAAQASVPAAPPDGRPATPIEGRRQAARPEPPAPAPAPRRFAELSSFVVGTANRVAFAAAQSAADRPGAVSPLVLHGPTSAGKTHLLEGILSSATRAQPGMSAVYLTAEQFTTYFLQALHGGGLPNFRRKYRGVQLLLIDDVHFFAGKRATLVELLHTIDAFLRDGRQLVLGLDRSPVELPELGTELVTRLQGGLVCRLDWPDHEMRLGIVRELAARLDFNVPADVQRYLAERLPSHARELAGALKRLGATSAALGRPISLDLADEFLGDLFGDAARCVKLPDIEAAICAVFGVDARALQSDGRTRAVSQPRMLAMWLARKYTRAAFSEIGEYFGRRSHSTVIAAHRTVGDWVRRRTMLDLAGSQCRVEDAIRRVEEKLKAG